MTLDAEWEDLADRVGAPPFYRAGWFNAWRRALGEGEPRTLEVRRDGRLQGVVPLLARGKTLVSQTSWHSPSFSVLAEDDWAREELCRILFSQPETLIDLNLLAMETAGGIDEFERAARDAGRLCVVRERIRSPFIDLPGTYAAYEKGLSSNRRRALRRKRRRLEEQGEVSFEINDCSGDLDACLEEMYALEGGGWKSVRGEAITSSPELEGFYTEVSRWAAEHDWLRFAFLRLDGRPIAVQMILEHGATWYFVRTGYDEEYRSFGPGAAILGEEIAYLCERPGLNRIELLGEMDPFKADWANGSTPRHWMLAYRRTPQGLARWAESSMRKAVGPRLRRLRTKDGD